MGNSCNMLEEAWKLYAERMEKNIPQVNGFMLVAGVLTAFVVGVGSFAPRYRRHPVVGAVFFGASSLFLPIISLVAGAMGEDHLFPDSIKQAARDCTMSSHTLLVLIWTGLVLDVSLSTTTELPSSLLVKALWLAYLVISNISFRVTLLGTKFIWSNHYVRTDVLILVILFSKLGFKFLMLYKARRSLALGRSPRFIVGYMDQMDTVCAAEHPPPLVVTGEDSVQVVEMAAGYKTNTPEKLVTVDRMWRRLDGRSMSEPKDLCLSFALFKLLRCRFAGYSVAESGVTKAHRFIQHNYIKGANHSAVLELIKDELRFFHNYTVSSIPILYSNYLLAMTRLLISLCTISYSVYLVVLMKAAVHRSRQLTEVCVCWHGNSPKYFDSKSIAITLADVTPVFVVTAVLILSETSYILSFMFSSWTKIAIICSYSRRSWRRYMVIYKCLRFLYRGLCRFDCVWDDRLGQSLILANRPLPSNISLGRVLVQVRRLLRMADEKIRANQMVTEAILRSIERLTTSNEAPGVVPEPLSPIDLLSSSMDGERAAYAIVAWHVATGLMEFRYPDPSDSKAAATSLSRYCAYLVSCHPQLISGDDEDWSKKLYNDARRDAGRAVARAPGAEYSQICEALCAEHNELLEDGVRIAEMLIQSQVKWEELTKFWSEMLLYIAPSDNVHAHADAIGRGGELVTLLWALLAHAGFARPHSKNL